MPLEEQQRVQAQRPILRVDAEQEQPHLIDVALAEQQPDERLRKQTSVGAFERLMNVGDGDEAGDRPAVDLRAHGAARVEDRLQFGREAAELRLGRRDESPVPLPRRAVDDPQPLDFARELREIQRPDDDA